MASYLLHFLEVGIMLPKFGIIYILGKYETSETTNQAG